MVADCAALNGSVFKYHINAFGFSGFISTDSFGDIHGEKGRIDAWQTRCRDGVGAGDAFHGAFCSALLNNLPLTDNLLSTSAAGALCCQGWGTRERLPDWQTIQSFMQSQPNPVYIPCKIAER